MTDEKPWAAIAEVDRLDDQRRERARRMTAENEELPPRALAVVRGGLEETSAIAKLRMWLETYRAAFRAASTTTVTTEADLAAYHRTVASRRTIAVLSGATGTGKTVAAVWLATQLKNVPTFLRAAELEVAGRYDRQAQERWQQAKGLILDDLGSEYVDAKGNFVATFEDFVDYHYAEQRVLIVTTNLKPEVFRARYGERVVDRLREAGDWLTVEGASLRGKARQAAP